MLTGRRVLFGCEFFVAPKAQGMVSWLVLRFPPCPGSPFLSHIFSMAGSKRSGEGVESRARVLGAFIEAQRRPLTWLPRSVHSPAKNGRFLPLLSFQHVYARSPPRLPTHTRSRGFFFLAACFLQVRPREPVNRPFFALLPRSPLIRHALTPVNRKLLCSSHSGVECHTSTRRRRRRAFDSFRSKQLGHPEPTSGTTTSSPPPWRNHHTTRSGSAAESRPESGS
jgi:hypothetical protein